MQKPSKLAQTPQIRFAGFTQPWEIRKLGEVAKVIRGERITKNNLIENGDYPVMSGGTSYFGRYFKFNREANTITVAQYGSAGYIAFITERFWANDVCYSLFPLEAINNKFLYYVLRNNQNLIYSLTTKATPDCLPKNKLESISISISSLQEQEKIGAFFSKLDKLISLQQRKVEKLKNIKKVLLNKMFI